MAFGRAQKVSGEGGTSTAGPQVNARGAVERGDDIRSQLRQVREAYQSDPALAEARAEQRKRGARYIAAKDELAAARTAHKPLNDSMASASVPPFPLKQAYKESLDRVKAAKASYEEAEYAAQQANHLFAGAKRDAIAKHAGAYRKIHRAAVIAFNEALKQAAEANLEVLAVQAVIQADLGADGGVPSCGWGELTADPERPGYTSRYESWKQMVKRDAGIHL